MSMDKFSHAQQALLDGDKVRARKLLSQLLLSDRNNEQAWLQMARLADTPQQVIECLEWALKINPHNPSTIKALQMLKRQPKTQVRSHGDSVPIATATPAIIGKKDFSSTPPWDIQSQNLLPLDKVSGKDLPSPHHKTNWSLLVGTMIVLFVALIAAIGPEIAPQDPMKENVILNIGDQWIIPPFDAFKVPGFILGSDEFGRDLLSRILYAIQPTILMVAAVAVVRLILGTIIGLGAGWFNSRLGRFLDLLISAALSVPVLIVALGAIAMLGAELGLIAFIIGLSINGWGETARFVREQTKIIKGQVYIESAHALGASPFQMLTQHVLRQVMPMVWMLFAFEISGTLMVTAGLGFLGYFIGGDVWVEVADFVSRRISGTPELGQMLATSWVSLLEPWPLVLTGSVIFITILGFNLLGDGLRIRLNPEYINRNSPIALLNHRFSMWFEQSVSYPVSTWLKANRLRPVMVMVAIVALVSIYYYTRTNASLTASHINLSAPGGQLWASEKINPYGTSYTDAPGLVEPQKLWEINQPAGFSGNPVISSDGTIYVAGLNATLVALNPDGSVIHTTGLPEIPMGPLAMGPEGNIYVTDAKGGLSALSSAGALLWTFNAVEFGKPNHGAIVAPDGTIYYLLEDPRGDTIFALFPDGQLKWSLKTGTRLVNTPLRLTPNAKEIFIKNVVVNVADGSLVELTLPTQGSAGRSGQDQLFVGSNGKTYLLAGHVVIEWKHTSQGFTRVNSAEWDYRDIGFYQVNAFPVDAAVIKPDKILLLYAGEFGATRVVWLDPTGKVLGTIRGPFYEDTHIVAIQGDGIITICGVGGTDRGAMTAMCSAYQADQDQPIWTYILGVELNGIVGAAMAPGRLYVITGNGTLTALGDVINSLSNPAPRP